VNARLKTGKGGPGLYNKVGATPFLDGRWNRGRRVHALAGRAERQSIAGNADNCTPLMAACGVGIGGAEADEVAGTEPEVLEAAQLLLKLGADVNAVDGNGETAMHGAAYKNLPKVAQFLADKGAKIEVWNRTNKWGWTPLRIAEGYRPGNFQTSAETVVALSTRHAGCSVTPQPARRRSPPKPARTIRRRQLKTRPLMEEIAPYGTSLVSLKF